MNIIKDENGLIVNKAWPIETVRAEAALAAMVEEQSRQAAVRAIPLDDDKTALLVAPACPEWAAGEKYEAGDIVNRLGQSYRVIQAVTAQEHQPPESAGLLAIYRPIETAHDGSIDDPIPYVNGMDVETGKYYTYNGLLYQAQADMKPCVWPPDTPGLWQWRQVTNQE